MEEKEEDSGEEGSGGKYEEDEEEDDSDEEGDKAGRIKELGGGRSERSRPLSEGSSAGSRRNSALRVYTEHSKAGDII